MIDSTLKKIFTDYKKYQASKYIPVRGDEILTKVFECENYSISTKYDGHLCFLVKKGKLVNLFNFNGIPFEREDLVSELDSRLDRDSIFVGEIYLFDNDNRTRSFDLQKQIGNIESEIKICVFDVVSYGDEQFDNHNTDRKKVIINELFNSDNKIHSVSETVVSSRKDIQIEFDSRVNNFNQEGIIVRGFNGPIFKIKPKLTFDVVVLGYSTGYSNDYSLLRELLFGVLTEENEYLIVGKVSTGFTIEQRKDLKGKLESLKVESEIIEPSSSKLPFTFIKPELVIELESLDIVNENSSSNIFKPRIKYSDSRYLKISNDSSVSLISPIFKGFREDKEVSVDQVGLQQIERVISINPQNNSESSKKKSEILKRQVYFKESKGVKMVKKYFVWKTNDDSNNYPSYVYGKIDYSPTRADKLQRDLKVSNDENQIIDIFSKSIEKDIKKGWIELKQ